MKRSTLVDVVWNLRANACTVKAMESAIKNSSQVDQSLTDNSLAAHSQLHLSSINARIKLKGLLTHSGSPCWHTIIPILLIIG